jgi:hypothetical protein
MLIRRVGDNMQGCIFRGADEVVVDDMGKCSRVRKQLGAGGVAVEDGVALGD